MELFKYVKNTKDLDERSIFANRVCKLIYQNHNGDLDKIMKDKLTKTLFEDFETHIDNVYELVENEIPLYSYYRLLIEGQDNWGLTDKEYERAIEDTKKACIKYYSKSWH